MGHPSNTQKEKQELINSQLKQQSSMKRILVSDAIASLMVRLIVLLYYFTYFCLGLCCKKWKGRSSASRIDGEEQTGREVRGTQSL